jgi:hypothetical protein
MNCVCPPLMPRRSLSLREAKVLEVLFHRPGRILSANIGSLMDVLLSPIAVRVDQLVRVMIEETMLEGFPPHRMAPNRSIRNR